MVQEALVRERLKLLASYIDDLQGVRETSEAEYAGNIVLQRFVERTLHLAIEACHYVGFHVISSEGYREPRFAREVVDVLADNGWIGRDSRERLQGMAGFRNLLVHDYATIEPRLVLEVLRTRLEDLSAFGAEVPHRLDAAAAP
ncbi:MAG: DUF86 domain-containing protein [Trueperaceae bacterium]|nr:DUF86 domain-containing protein [Trueperaceae bacterium]